MSSGVEHYRGPPRLLGDSGQNGSQVQSLGHPLPGLDGGADSTCCPSLTARGLTLVAPDSLFVAISEDTQETSRVKKWKDGEWRI